MSMSRTGLGLASLVVTAACAGLPFWTQDDAKLATDDTQIPPRVRVEFQDVQYDGLVLSGRVLISPEEKSLRLNKRFLPDIQSVADCARQPHARLIMDYFGSMPSAEDLLVLEPGYWYGRTVRFVLFSEHFTGIGPECIDAQLLISSFDGKRVASVPIRAVGPPRPERDGGVPEGLRHLIDDPAFSILKKLPQVDLSELPEGDGGVAPPQP
jgi:hypothetical protein